MTLIESEFHVIRATILARYPRPFLAIMSAAPQDGRAYLADGLASSLVSIGLRTALVIVDESLAHVSSAARPPRSLKSPDVIVMAEAAKHDVVNLRQLIKDLRDRYDAVVMVGGHFNNSDAMLHIAMLADCVIAAVETARPRISADADFVAALKLSSCNLLAVVQTAPATSGYQISASAPRLSSVKADIPSTGIRI
jgi:hypothetical protein